MRGVWVAVRGDEGVLVGWRCAGAGISVAGGCFGRPPAPIPVPLCCGAAHTATINMRAVCPLRLACPCPSLVLCTMWHAT